MYCLTNEQISFIEREVDNDEITYSHLRYELIDHVCCEIESQMQAGIYFKEAYDKIRNQSGFKGFKKIQTDTLSLIDKNYRIMRNMMKIGGMAALILLGFGTVFKINHWPGAGIMLLGGFFLMCFVFFPTALYVMNRESKMKGKNIVFASVFIGGITFMLGTLFKVQHWPGAGLLLMVGDVILLFLFIPSLLYYKMNSTADRKKRQVYLLGALSLMLFLGGSFFKMFHWPGAQILIITGSISLISVFLPVYAYREYKNSQHVHASFIYIIIAFMYFTLFETLLAMNVSKPLVSDYIHAEKMESSSTKQLDDFNQTNYNLLLNDSTVDQAKLLTLRENTNELCAYLQDLKIRLITRTEQVEAEQAGKLVDNIELLHNMTESKIPTQFMLGEYGKATELKNKIDEYKKLLTDYVQDNPATSEAISNILSTGLPSNYAEFYTSWEEAQFGNVFLSGDIGILSHIQYNLRIAENLALKSKQTSLNL
ncbi:MAG: hypothetical protein K9H62_13820 [Bacteroidales bacterium]|nr:hypothetical protein [Bacteroidales bacterium]